MKLMLDAKIPVETIVLDYIDYPCDLKKGYLIDNLCNLILNLRNLFLKISVISLRIYEMSPKNVTSA